MTLTWREILKTLREWRQSAGMHCWRSFKMNNRKNKDTDSCKISKNQ